MMTDSKTWRQEFLSDTLDSFTAIPAEDESSSKATAAVSLYTGDIQVLQMNVTQSSRTVDDVASLQQMHGIFSNPENSYYFFTQMKRRSHAGPEMTRVAALAFSCPPSMCTS